MWAPDHVRTPLLSAVCISCSVAPFLPCLPPHECEIAHLMSQGWARGRNTSHPDGLRKNALQALVVCHPGAECRGMQGLATGKSFCCLHRNLFIYPFSLCIIPS